MSNVTKTRYWEDKTPKKNAKVENNHDYRTDMDSELTPRVVQSNPKAQGGDESVGERPDTSVSDRYTDNQTVTIEKVYCVCGRKLSRKNGQPVKCDSCGKVN